MVLWNHVRYGLPGVMLRWLSCVSTEGESSAAALVSLELETRDCKVEFGDVHGVLVFVGMAL